MTGAAGPDAGSLPGSQFPLGATVSDGGTNFAVASAVAGGMVLCLFDEAGAETQIPLRDYDAGVWHAFVPGVGAGQAYGYRATGPYDPVPSALALGLYLDGSDDPDRADDGGLLLDDDFLVLVNAWWEPLEFALPVTRAQAAWHVEIDTYDPTPPASSAARRAGDSITVCPRSVVVLACPLDANRGHR